MRKNLLLISLIFSITACSNTISGSWKQIIVPDNGIQAFLGYSADGTPNYTLVAPFNTSMYLKYFLNDKNNDNDTLLENVTNTYTNEIIRLHKLFDRHYKYLDDKSELITNVKTINESYGTNTPIKCSDELYSLLKLAVECYDLTNGYFNIFTGSITDYWETIFSNLYDYGSLDDNDPYYNESQKTLLENYVKQIPNTKEEIEAQLTFDDENKTVTFNKINDGNIEYRPIISVGGIAKGYANDIVKEKLVNSNYTDGILMSGASSITSLSKPIHSKETSGQNISIINPATSTFFDSKAAFSLTVDDEFVFSTSGNYTTNKSYYFIDNDNNIVYRHHILNPYTGYPESYHRSVSILSYKLSSGMVDVLTTAMMNLSLEDALSLRKEIISKNSDYYFDMFILDQENTNENAKLTIHATNNVNSTFKGIDGVEVIYEE